MDARLIKTNRKIYEAFSSLLLKKDYNSITIQDVLIESKIARSTFYAHYKTKDDLLKSICSSIFTHVFSHSLEVERSHDFSKTSILDYRHFITHILYHLDDDKKLISAILSSQSKLYFLDYLRELLYDFAKICLDNNFFPQKNIPSSLKLSSIIENFILIIEYWNKDGFKTSPELLTEYFIALNN